MDVHTYICAVLCSVLTPVYPLLYEVCILATPVLSVQLITRHICAVCPAHIITMRPVVSSSYHHCDLCACGVAVILIVCL